MNTYRIVDVVVANGEMLITIEDNRIIREYTLEEADNRYGEENINIKLKEYGYIK